MLRFRFLTFLRRGTSQPPLAYIDIEQVERQRAIREAEYQALLDRESRVMRVSGKKYRTVARRPIVERTRES